LGRPTDYNEDISAEICAHLSMGESLRKVCRRKGMPAASTVFLWLSKYPGFSEQYARAKGEAADMFIEDMLEIADDAKKDKIPKYETNEETGERELVGYDESKTSVQRARVQIDTRKWLAIKLKPRKYGDLLKLDGKQELSGELTHTHSYSDLSDEELRARAKALLEAKDEQ